MAPLIYRVVAPGLGVLACAGLLAATRGLDDVVPGQQLGPSFWPRLVLAGLAATCLVRLVSEARREPRPAPAEPDTGVEALPPISWPKLGAAMALVLLYVLAAPVLGFPLATAGFIAGFMGLCRAPVAAIAANAVVGTVILLYLFVKAVYLPLPKGDGPFEAATLALYRALHIF